MKKRNTFMKASGATMIAGLVTAGVVTPTYVAAADQDAMSMYFDAQQNTNEERWERVLEYSETSLELQDRLLEEAYQSDSKVTMGLDVKSPAIPQLKGIQNLISTAKFETSSKLDPSTNEMYADMNVFLQNFNIGGASFYQNDDRTAVKVPVMYDTYFAFQNDEFGEVMNRLDSMGAEEVEGDASISNETTVATTEDMMPEFPNFVEANETSFTFDELKTMGENYLDVITTELKEANFSLKKDVDFKGETYNQVSIDVSEENAQDMIKSLLEELKNDEVLWDAMTQQLEMQGMPSSEQEVLMTELDKAIENVDQLELGNGISIEAYIKDNIVEHEVITMKLQSPESEKPVTVKLEGSYNNESDEQYSATGEIFIGQGEGGLTLSYTEDGTSTENGLSVDNEFRLVMDAENDAEDMTIGLDLTTDYTETSSNSTFDVVLDGGMLQGQAPNIGGFINTTLTQSSADEYSQDTEFGLDLSMKDPTMGSIAGSLNFNVEQDIEFTDNLEFPEITEENAVDLGEVSEEELQEIGAQIEKNMTRYGKLFMYIFGDKLFPKQ